MATGLIASEAASDVQTVLTTATTPIAIGVVYALARSAEPHLPVWLRRLVLGSAVPPRHDQ
ncbi:hypothetical protein [Actinopolyspora mortivallis]|uniref:hypothetical protein n=1 Tax=Actinopolyspora mortivallis TaxID=33906 RepID=UPI00037697FF|nr:hypothetical protein [Actinopolyspora mortivallis]